MCESSIVCGLALFHSLSHRFLNRICFCICQHNSPILLTAMKMKHATKFLYETCNCSPICSAIRQAHAHWMHCSQKHRRTRILGNVQNATCQIRLICVMAFECPLLIFCSSSTDLLVLRKPSCTGRLHKIQSLPEKSFPSIMKWHYA